ncbi:efflux transporter outer membrane subunit [Dyella ginsengisoli]|uniref:efflux transporter outer membrane subunit n=1 Tax=Dyella ginsengisoli TaxID=363848 RepID=UPI00034DCB79|nr:efflux transporter outer membrane subunit [Dyella ginsengisoli]
MRLHHLAAGIGFSLLLAACATSGGLHPNGTLTDPSSLATDQSLARVHAAEATWPSQDWWTALGDPQLDTLIAEALRDNPGLAVADARAREAQTAVVDANAARGPSVNAGAAVSGARLPASVPIGGHFLKAEYGYASFNWGLDLWGGKKAAWEAAVGAAKAADIESRAARIELSANVARAYARLGYAFAQKDVADAEYRRASEARKLTAQRVAAGIDSQLQLKQGDAEVAQAQRQQAVADRAVDAARSALSVLLGKGPDRGLSIGRPAVLQPSAVAVPANLPADLIGHRPDLVAARWRVEAAGKQIKAAKTEFLPNVSIGAMAGLLATGGHNLFELPARFYQFGPSLSLPIFDGGRLRANLDRQDAAYDMAVAQYNQTLVGAVNEVADDLSALDSLRTQIDAQQHALDAAGDAWQLAEQRYKAGVGSYLEALTVRQQLLQAEQGMAALKAQQVDTSVQLLAALGGGYRPRDASAVPPSVSPSPVSPSDHS